MTNWRNRISYIGKYLLLLLFIGYYGGVTLFYHGHLVDGRVITHSHPFKGDQPNKTPFEKHQHPGKAFCLFDQLNKINSEEATVGFSLPAPSISYFEKIITLYDIESTTFTGCSKQLRAPPFSIS